MPREAAAWSLPVESGERTEKNENDKDKKKKTKKPKAETIIGEEGRILKMEVDYTKTCDEKISLADQLFLKGKLQEAIDLLMAFEKLARTGADAHSTWRVLVALVDLCFRGGDWELLNETIVSLTKKRSQIKSAVTKMVGKCCEFLKKTPDKETKLKLMETLRNVTAGKIYVEVERARLTHQLALIREEEGDINEAANILQELQVETFGSMEKKEKVELILEQMRLCLLKKDYVRTQIISKKVQIRFFENTDHDEFKLKFYRLMIDLDMHDGSYLNICRHYRAIYETKSISETEKETVLKHVVLYVILASFNIEQSDLLHRVDTDKRLNDMQLYKDLLKLFITPELIKYGGLCSVYEKELRSDSTTVFPDTIEGNDRWVQLKNRVVEHNIRMMEKYYTKISLKRMAVLLDLSEKESEDFLCQLVVSGTIIARMDRLEGVVNFGTPPEHSTQLNDWAFSLHHLMALVNRTTHLINKEEMVHKHLVVAATE